MYTVHVVWSVYILSGLCTCCIVGVHGVKSAYMWCIWSKCHCVVHVCIVE